MVTIRQIASIAKVSPGLVSRIIKKDPTLRVSDVTRARVESVIHKYNYHVPENKHRPVTILIALSKKRVLSDPYFSELLDKLFIFAKQLNLFINNVYYLPSEDVFNSLKYRQGIIAVGPFTTSALIKMKKSSKCLVVIDDNTRQDDFNIIQSNFSEVTWKLLNNFIQLGRQRIVFIGGDIIRTSTAGKEWEKLIDQRLATYYRWSKYQSLPLRIINDELTLKGGETAANQLLEQSVAANNLPNAVLALNDLVARGLVDRLVAKGIKIPEDICVASFDDLSITRAKKPTITSVQLSVEGLANAAIRLIYELMMGQVVQTNIITVPSKIHYRTSCPSGYKS